jgi:hypothetical protein
MANTYDAEAATAAPEGEGASQGKVSQQEANYRMGNPQRSCGLCQYFTGSDGPGAYACTKVDGEISPFGFSDLYGRQDNPFIPGVQEGFDTEDTTEGAAPDEESDAGPALQIGNRRYA